MPRGSGERGDSIDLPKWWLDLAMPMLNNGLNVAPKKFTLALLGKKAAEHVGRKKHWDHSAVKGFIDGSNRTRQMAIGLSIELGVPLPVYIPKTMPEALEMQAVARRYQAIPANPESGVKRLARLALTDREMDDAERDSQDQSARIDSVHEGDHRGRRTRRPARGRPPAS